MNKQAQWQKYLWPLLGAAGGGALGRYVMPHPEVGGYSDVPQARSTSQLLWATEGALLPGILAKLKGAPPALQAGAAIASPFLLGGTEMFPQMIAQQQRNAEAARRVAAATESASIPANLKRFLGGDIAKGIGGGAAAAGLAAIATGLSRRKTDEEERLGRTHAQMIGHDLLRYLLPAMVAGGVIGSLKGPVVPPTA